MTGFFRIWGETLVKTGCQKKRRTIAYFALQSFEARATSRVTGGIGARVRTCARAMEEFRRRGVRGRAATYRMFLELKLCFVLTKCRKRMASRQAEFCHLWTFFFCSSFFEFCFFGGKPSQFQCVCSYKLYREDCRTREGVFAFCEFFLKRAPFRSVREKNRSTKWSYITATGRHVKNIGRSSFPPKQKNGKKRFVHMAFGRTSKFPKFLARSLASA